MNVALLKYKRGGKSHLLQKLRILISI